MAKFSHSAHRDPVCAEPHRGLSELHMRVKEQHNRLCVVQGVQLDASSAGALHESLQALKHHEDARTSLRSCSCWSPSPCRHAIRANIAALKSFHSYIPQRRVFCELHCSNARGIRHVPHDMSHISWYLFSMYTVCI